MSVMLNHDMQPRLTNVDRARGRFVSGVRSFILNDLASDMRSAYDQRVRPAFERREGRAMKDGAEVHKALRGDPAFSIYSAMRVQAQKMVWSTVIPIVDREAERLQEEASKVADLPGSVRLDPALEIPRNVSAIDVHLLPGSYVGDGVSLKSGAVYDQGLSVFSMGLMGDNLDDIGRSMSSYISQRYPDFSPTRVLDVGCTIGHNSLPWKRTYPEAQVDAIDVAASGLLYGSARAKMQGQEVHFNQMAADQLGYEDESFDLVFSSMFLHELSHKVRSKVFAEAYRVLRPGGLMLHMELPPNDQMDPFDAFYLDWDSYYNEEPFSKGYRDQDPRKLCENAGFSGSDYIQFVVPSIGLYGTEVVKERATSSEKVMLDDKTGRLADGVQWFGFGAWKH